MIKVFCDKCGKEIIDNINTVMEEIKVKDCCNNEIMKFDKTKYHLCNECNKRFNLLHLDISDFMKFNEKELEFLESTFRVGDEVITSTGEVGRIIDICTCDRCKERGFYEPTVEVEIGNNSIYITDNDKRNNFSSFYKIGDRIFGNIDEDAVKDSIKSVKEQVYKLQNEHIELNSQLDVINILKKKNKTIHNEEN